MSDKKQIEVNEGESLERVKDAFYGVWKYMCRIQPKI